MHMPWYEAVYPPLEHPPSGNALWYVWPPGPSHEVWLGTAPELNSTLRTALCAAGALFAITALVLPAGAPRKVADALGALVWLIVTVDLVRFVWDNPNYELMHVAFVKAHGVYYTLAGMTCALLGSMIALIMKESRVKRA
jgi:hypothetical protein